MGDEIHEVALRLLSRRRLSVGEVTERLARRGFQAAEVRDEIGRLGRVGLVDDGALAGAVVGNEVQRGRGRRAIAATLRRRRVGGDVIDAALSEISDGDEAESLSRALARATRKYPRWRRLPEQRRKVIRYLLARGFGPRLVRDAMAASRRGDADDAADVEPGDTPELS
jgi:regulatory protein